MKSFAGDIEAGDKILAGQVLPVSTDQWGGFASQVVQRDQTVVDVRDNDFGHQRVLVRTSAEITYDLHRTHLVRVFEGQLNNN